VLPHSPIDKNSLIGLNACGVREKMRVGIAYSLKDPAGVGVAARIISRRGLVCVEPKDPRASTMCEDRFVGLTGFVDDVLYLEYLDKFFQGYSAVVILSRHKAASGMPSFTVHYTGNPGGEALYGGRPGKLGVSKPSLGSSLLHAIYMHTRSSSLGSIFSVTYEATHHGPTDNEIPVVFAEIGSSEKEWVLEEAHDAWASAIDTAILEGIRCSSIAIGLGGNHYPGRFTELTIGHRVCFGHIIPRYVLKGLGEAEVVEVVRQALRASVERIGSIYVEEKAAQANKLKAIERVALEHSVEVRYL